jgi:hypothetical protein
MAPDPPSLDDWELASITSTSIENSVLHFVSDFRAIPRIDKKEK